MTNLMSKVFLFFVFIFSVNNVFAGVYFYNCKTTETNQILKAGESADLYVKLIDNLLVINNRGQIWNYLSLQSKNDGELVYSSLPPENFLQSTDLIARTVDNLTDGIKQGVLTLTNTTTNLMQTYNCSL